MTGEGPTEGTEQSRPNSSVAEPSNAEATVAASPRSRRPRWMLGLAGSAAAVAIAYWIASPTRHEPVGSVVFIRAGSSSVPGGALPLVKPAGAVLHGTVVDGTGVVVAGLRVAIAMEGKKPPATAMEATTASDGRFLAQGLSPGRYRISVSGSAILAAELRYVAVPGDDVRVVVSRRVSIEGAVTDGKRPVGGATIAVLSDALGGALELKADSRGRFLVPSLPEGRYQVYGWRADLAARAVRVTRLGAGPFAPVELRLEAAAIVVGTVIDRDEGTGIVAAVELRPSSGDAPPRYARSGSDGVFRIEGVPTGRWIADAFAPGYISPGGVELDAGKGTPQLLLERGAAVEGRVMDGNGQPISGASVRAFSVGVNRTEVSAAIDVARLQRFSGRGIAPVAEALTAPGDLQLIARGELGVLVGPIPPLPPPGAPAAAVAAVVVDPSATSHSLLKDPAPIASDPDRDSVWTTGSDGRYRVRGISPGKVRIVASAPGLAEAQSRVIAIDASGSMVRNIDMVLTRGALVTGMVKDQKGAPVVGAEVSAHPEVGTAVFAFTGSDGRYRLGPVAGAVELRVVAFGCAEVRRSVDPGRGSAATWTEDFDLETADAALAGTVVDSSGVPIGSAQLVVATGLARKRHATTAVNGAFSIDKLPRGSMRIRVSHPDYPTSEFDAVASLSAEQVRFVLASGGAVEGAVLDSANGAPLGGLLITAEGPGGAVAETSSDKAGRWRLGPVKSGRWKLTLNHPGYLQKVRELEVPPAHRTSGTLLRDVRIDLTRGALVGGTVRDARGRRVAGAQVVITSTAGEASGTSDGNGEFRIHDAPTGDIAVHATRDHATGQARATVVAGSEVLGLAVEIR